MELILTQLARRSLRIATAAHRVLAVAIARGDVESEAIARMDLLVARAVARAAVHHLHHYVKRGEIPPGAAAEIGLELVAVLNPAEPVHPSRVMAGHRALPYHRSDVLETVRETEVLQILRTRGTGASIGMPSDG